MLQHQRRGVTAVEMSFILAAVAVAVIAGVFFLGGNTNARLQTTADTVADPTNLVGRWGGGGGSGDNSASDNSSEGGSSDGGSGGGGDSSNDSDGSSDDGDDSGSLCP